MARRMMSPAMQLSSQSTPVAGCSRALTPFGHPTLNGWALRNNCCVLLRSTWLLRSPGQHPGCSRTTTPLPCQSLGTFCASIPVHTQCPRSCRSCLTAAPTLSSSRLATRVAQRCSGSTWRPSWMRAAQPRCKVLLIVMHLGQVSDRNQRQVVRICLQCPLVIQCRSASHQAHLTLVYALRSPR